MERELGEVGWRSVSGAASEDQVSSTGSSVLKYCFGLWVSDCKR